MVLGGVGVGTDDESGPDVVWLLSTYSIKQTHWKVMLCAVNIASSSAKIDALIDRKIRIDRQCLCS